MNPRYPLVATRAEYRCEYCHAPQVLFNFPFEVEHIQPTSQGGADEEGNWALACRACNVRKSDRTRAIDPLSGEQVPLFHPRRDRWSEHFRFAVETGELVGLTPIGRATLACLQLNDPFHVEARCRWFEIGLGE